MRRSTRRKIREERLSDSERAWLRERASYEGRAYHKREPNDFGLTPPMDPRPDKTLCDEAGIHERAIAQRLLALAIEHGLVSESTSAAGFPKQMWVVADGRVFEAMYGGTRDGQYHGYPIRRSDPLFDEIVARWGEP